MHSPTILVGAGLAVALMTGCASAPPATGPAAEPADQEQSPSPAPAVSPDALDRAARADSVRAHYTDADVAFMTGMIHHHAQALVMARMAPSHDASPTLRTLAERIIAGQKDEIFLMQRWLRDRGEPVPEVDGDDHAGHAAHAAHPEMAPMAGMLTPGQLARLDGARGPQWDRLFLTYMIQHHQGALVMVEELFAAAGAGQGDEIFKIASDIGVDQATEIDRMQRMLEDLVFGSDPE